MKKFKYILLVLLLCITLTACSTTKKALTPDEFSKIMEKEDFSVIDVISQFEDYDYISSVYIAMDPTNSYQIEYFEFDTNNTAIKYYNQNKQIFENTASDKYLSSYVDLTNSNKYELSSDSEYKLVARIDNTMIYVNTTKQYKNDIEKIIKKLGY